LDSFFDLGGHSLLAIHLVSAVQRELGVNLALHAVLEAATVERQAELISGTGGQRVESVVIPLRYKENSDATFFWIHPLGGTVLCYHDLARLLGPDTSSYGLQAPMLFEGADSYTDLDALAARYVTEIRSVQPSGPYRIGGWSAGGILSVAVARLLALAGERVQYVGVIEADAPPAGAGADPHPRTLVAALLDRPELTARADLASPPPEMVTEPFADRHPIVAKWLRAHGLVPADQEDRIARLLMVQRRIFRLATPDRLDHYPGTVHVYRTAGRTAEPGLGWQRWANRVVDHEVPGTHETVLHQPNVGRLAELIRRAAQEVTGDADES
jgi:thioesterase domain-containing protein